MRIRNPLFVLSLLCLIGVGAYAYSLQQMNAVLNPANQIFLNMQNRDYRGIWKLLSSKSKKIVIDSICYTMKKRFHKTCDRVALRNDFKKGVGPAVYYWRAYLRHFNPETVLKKSRWSIKYIKQHSAVISIKYRKAPHPFFLKMDKEHGHWKVGLLESVLSHY